MKRSITILLLTFVTLFSLAGCGKNNKECAECGEIDGKLTEVEVNGETVTMCEDCYDLFHEGNEFDEALNEALDEIYDIADDSQAEDAE